LASVSRAPERGVSALCGTSLLTGHASVSVVKVPYRSGSLVCAAGGGHARPAAAWRRFSTRAFGVAHGCLGISARLSSGDEPLGTKAGKREHGGTRLALLTGGAILEGLPAQNDRNVVHVRASRPGEDQSIDSQQRVVGVVPRKRFVQVQPPFAQPPRGGAVYDAARRVRWAALDEPPKDVC